MAKRPVRIIVNPVSGRGQDRRFIAELARHMTLRGFQAEVTPTTHRGHARELAAAVSDDARCVISIGGDGTHREVISGLIGRPVPLCVVPAGTENVLAHTFRAQGTLQDIVMRVQDGQPRAVDIGRVNGFPFAMFSGIGFDADVTHKVHEKRGGTITRHAYYGPIVRLWWSFRSPRLAVTVDGRPLAEDIGYLLVANMPRYADGLHIAPQALADDGLLDVVCFRARSRWELAGLFLKAKRGRHLEDPRVTHGRGTRIEVTSPAGPARVQTDGDAVTTTPVTYTVLPKAVQFLVLPQVSARSNA
jgi:diacylglycerol kinase (ATP)